MGSGRDPLQASIIEAVQNSIDALTKSPDKPNKNKIEISGNKTKTNEDKVEKAKNIIKKVKSENRSVLYFREAKEIMDIYGINTVEFQEVNTDKELEIEFPMVMKVDSEKALHKTDKGGVILDIKNEDEFRIAYQKMNENFPKENIIIQPMQEIKTELIVGIKKNI
jgi:acyl-CoA synthetase (NDP forming)